MDLVISRKHVRAGTHDSISDCPTNMALRDVGFSDALVDAKAINADGKWRKMSKTLIAVISDYDKGEPFRTGTYRIAGLKKPTKSKEK